MSMRRNRGTTKSDVKRKRLEDILPVPVPCWGLARNEPPGPHWGQGCQIQITNTGGGPDGPGALITLYTSKEAAEKECERRKSTAWRPCELRTHEDVLNFLAGEPVPRYLKLSDGNEPSAPAGETMKLRGFLIRQVVTAWLNAGRDKRRFLNHWTGRVKDETWQWN